MLFPTFTFHLFFLLVFAIVWSIKRDNEWRKIVILVTSWFFYGWWDWRFVALLIASGFLNWGAAQLILRSDADERARKIWLWVGVVANLAILATFKYFGFFAEQLAALLHGVGWGRDMTILEIVLPVGVSFFTFQGMSYLIDIYRRQTKAASLLDLTLLMSFFPHLVSGPIVRASHLIPQFQTIPRLTRSMVAAGIALILWGLVKKTVIASELAIAYVDPVFFDPTVHSSLDLLIAAYAYGVQIYCDFSAYSDMAVGIAILLGYRFPWNFNQPYRAASLQDFWRRWHISLSSWLRDYLYIALGGSRHGIVRLCLALMTTMLLGGLWHGASWNFVIWGAIHGVVLAAERLWREYRPKDAPVLPAWAGVLITFHVVTLAWIFFRAESFDVSLAYIGGIFAFSGAALTATPLVLLLVLVGLSLHAFPRDGVQRAAVVLRDLRAWQVAALGVAVLLLVEMVRPDGVAPFIYYQF